jgi:hypothetical protein
MSRNTQESCRLNIYWQTVTTIIYLWRCFVHCNQWWMATDKYLTCKTLIETFSQYLIIKQTILFWNIRMRCKKKHRWHASANLLLPVLWNAEIKQRWLLWHKRTLKLFNFKITAFVIAFISNMIILYVYVDKTLRTQIMLGSSVQYYSLKDTVFKSTAHTPLVSQYN